MKLRLALVCKLLIVAQATFFGREITLGDGTVYRVAGSVETAAEVERMQGCDVTCGEYCFLFSTGEHAREYSALTSEELKNCVGYCGCEALLEKVAPTVASGKSEPKPAEATPVQPSPSTPSATEPQPAQPTTASGKSKPKEEPKPVEPVPAQPVPAQPSTPAAEATPVQPAASEPQAAPTAASGKSKPKEETKPAEPTPAPAPTPAPVEPTPASPPAPAEPAPVQPTTASGSSKPKPPAADPAPAQPSAPAAEPVPAQPTTASGKSTPKPAEPTPAAPAVEPSPAPATSALSTSECYSRCTHVCNSDAPDCFQSCITTFCPAQIPSQPQSLLAALAWDLLLLVVCAGLFYGIYKRLSSRSKRNYWRNRPMEANYTRLEDY